MQWCWLAALLIASGCATKTENAPLTAGHANEERRQVDLSQPDRPLIMLAISGGGSRAAALGWSVMQDLRRFNDSATTAQPPRTLLDDVAVVSSVSGGSVIAAQFGLYGAAGLDRFATDFLAPDNTRALALDGLDPFGWLRLSVTGSSRIDLVEAMLDKELFQHKTFSELNQRGKPYVIMNATDMASGEIFAFTPKRFDDLCADFDQEEISVGVASSAAVPVVFSPVALQDFFDAPCTGTVTSPDWISSTLGKRYSPYLNLENYRLAGYANDLRHGAGSDRAPKFLYLLDGGLTDNLAAHGLIEAISSPYAAPIIGVAGSAPPATILDAINVGAVKTVVVIAINARSDPPNDISTSASRPGVLKMVESVASIPIDSNTAGVTSQLDVLLSQLKASGSGGAGDPKFAGLKVYGIQVNFDQLSRFDPKQKALRDSVKSIPTLWTVTESQRAALDEAAQTLLHQHPCFQRLLIDLGTTAAFIDHDFAMQGCRQASDPS